MEQTFITSQKRSNIIKMKLERKDSKDNTRIPGTNLYVSHGSDGNWSYRVKLTKKQSIIGFKKFGTVGIGFSEEVDGNTNLPISCSTEEIYNHIKENKGDKKIRKEHCLKAINLIKDARLRDLMDDTISKLNMSNMSDEKRLAILSTYLRQSGSHEIANVYDQDARFWAHKANL